MVLYVPPISNSILYFFFWFFSFFASLKRSAYAVCFFHVLHDTKMPDIISEIRCKDTKNRGDLQMQIPPYA